MRNWFRGLKLNQKFTVTTLIFIFIPLFGMMCFGFRSIKKNAIDHGVNEAVTAIDLTCAKVNAKANACSMVVDTLQEYEPLEKYLLHLRRGEEISESYYQQFRNNSISIIDKMQEAMPDLYQIHIFAMADGFLEQQPILYQKEKMKNCAWYRSYQGGGQWFFDIQEKNIISGTKKEGSHLMTYVRELRDQSGGRLGVIEVSMRMVDIFPEIYRSGDSSWACFVDENWNLYDCGKTAAACKWQSYRGLILFRAGIRDRKESQQSAVIDRKNVAIVLRKVDKLNGMFVTLTNLDDATGNMIKQQQRMLLEFAGFGLLLIVVVNLIVRGLLKEFYDVLCEMRQIDNGTTKIKVCYSAEEMREMSYGINGMLERIQKQNEESIKREAALKDTAIRAMQNQINAHFIYNVLESIKMMAEIDEEYTISDAVTALGEMLHYNMRWNKFLVTVQDEMNYIQNYVELMNLRYDFTITLSVQIPENLYRQDIPKMSLQPIVENAITHGIEELDADAVIEIKGIEHEKSFEIEITDSGIGMSEKHRSVMEIPEAYQEALLAREMAFIQKNPVEEYQKKCFEEKPELAQFQEKFILQVPTDRADTVLRKMRNWYFEAAHQRVSPYQLLTVTEAICKELDLFYRMPEKQEKCPRPLQYRDADLFLDAFEEWIHVYRESLKSQTAGKEKMEEAISYIRENYAKDLNMAMVSNHICMNYSLFSAAFKEHTGVNFVNYLKEIRIAEAKSLLIQTEDKITEIAKQVGFENDKHFMKSFKTACGVSPSEFRKDYKMVSNGKGGQDE